jgi:hypothetical protein
VRLQDVIDKVEVVQDKAIVICMTNTRAKKNVNVGLVSMR